MSHHFAFNLLNKPLSCLINLMGNDRDCKIQFII